MDFTRFYDSDTLSDLKLSFDGRQISVHRVLLCAQSKWFARALEGNFVEARLSTIELHEDDFEGLEDMIRCLYGIDVFPSLEVAEGLPETYQTLRQLVQVYIKADKYAADDLRTDLIMKIDWVAERVWGEWFFAEGYLGKIITLIFSNLPIKDALCLRIAAMMKQSLKDFYRVDPEALCVLLEQIPDLGSEICIAIARSPPTRPVSPVRNDDSGWGYHVDIDRRAW